MDAMDRTAAMTRLGMGATQLTVELQNTNEGHHKGYLISLDLESHTVTVAWGRIGFLVSSRTYTAADVDAAIAMAGEKLDTRLANGYRIVTPTTRALPICA